MTSQSVVSHGVLDDKQGQDFHPSTLLTKGTGSAVLLLPHAVKLVDILTVLP